jgi:hypothetical protein
MGNLLSTEDLENENEYDEPVKTEKKKRRTRAKTAKKRDPPSNSGFGLFTDSGESLENNDDVIESFNFDDEYREPVKPKRRKKATTVSRRKKVAWEEDEDAEY